MPSQAEIQSLDASQAFACISLIMCVGTSVLPICSAYILFIRASKSTSILIRIPKIQTGRNYKSLLS